MTGHSDTAARHHAAPSARYQGSIERIPHLTAKVCMTWGSRELDAFLSHLLMDSRDGSRQGLPVDIANEVLFLMQANKVRRAIELARGSSLPLNEAYRRVDSDDQARLAGDVFSDPLVSRDTSTRGSQRSSARTVQEAPAHSGGQMAALGELILMFVRSRWVLGAIFVMLTSKFAWPVAKTFF
jgi:hypothetical protein